MPYTTNGRRRPLGDVSAGTTALISTGANLIVPGSGPIIAVGTGILNSLFGGNQDAVRQAREQVFEQGAKQGSITAGRIMIGGTLNTASHESPMYQAGIQRLQQDPVGAKVMAAAALAGPYWDTTDNASSDKMRALIENELLQLKNAPSSSSTSPASTLFQAPASTPTPVRIAGMTTTAPYNWAPWIIAGALGLAVVLPFVVGPSSRRRR